MITTDRNDPRLAHEHDEEPREMAEAYLVLSKQELEKGFIRPYRTTYKHRVCGAMTTMGPEIAATYARDPKFYSGTYCVGCQKHRPVEEFSWLDGQKVGS